MNIIDMNFIVKYLNMLLVYVLFKIYILCKYIQNQNPKNIIQKIGFWRKKEKNISQEYIKKYKDL